MRSDLPSVVSKLVVYTAQKNVRVSKERFVPWEFRLDLKKAFLFGSVDRNKNERWTDSSYRVGVTVGAEVFALCIGVYPDKNVQILLDSKLSCPVSGSGFPRSGFHSHPIRHPGPRKGRPAYSLCALINLFIPNYLLSGNCGKLNFLNETNTLEYNCRLFLRRWEKISIIFF